MNIDKLIEKYAMAGKAYGESYNGVSNVKMRRYNRKIVAECVNVAATIRERNEQDRLYKKLLAVTHVARGESSAFLKQALNVTAKLSAHVMIGKLLRVIMEVLKQLIQAIFDFFTNKKLEVIRKKLGNLRHEILDTDEFEISEDYIESKKLSEWAYVADAGKWVFEISELASKGTMDHKALLVKNDEMDNALTVFAKLPNTKKTVLLKGDVVKEMIANMLSDVDATKGIVPHARKLLKALDKVKKEHAKAAKKEDSPYDEDMKQGLTRLQHTITKLIGGVMKINGMSLKVGVNIVSQADINTKLHKKAEKGEKLLNDAKGGLSKARASIKR